MLRFAFAGFRHSHIMDIYRNVSTREDTEIVAACEEDIETRNALIETGNVRITHSDFETMLRETECDVVAIGDYYSKRGGIAIAALKAGKHVISDKPVCTDINELEKIQRLTEELGTSLGCQLDLRSYGSLITLRDIIKSGEIGRVHTMTVLAQHPLLTGRRPSWYFEEGCHGGTINDIGIHAVDLVNWLAGREAVEIVAARDWNAKAIKYPDFKDAAQFMLRLDNDGSIFCDMSYLAPETSGYSLMQYWRVTCHGDKGMAETSLNAKDVLVVTDLDKAERRIGVQENIECAYLSDFIAEIRGLRVVHGLTTAQIIKASRIALLVQEAANSRRHDVIC